MKSNKTNLSLAILMTVLMLGCSSVRIPNDPHRGEDMDHPNDLNVKIDPVECHLNDCSNAVIEVHKDYDLAFIEFTERGNIFNREAMNATLELVKKNAGKKNGVAVYVFVHGWKHNAYHNDSNVTLFKESLQTVAEKRTNSKQRIVGVYVGWRGSSWNIPVLENLTFWDRKAAAEEVGQGGVTELLTQLHYIIRNVGQDNAYLVIGHSFGGAIVLSSLHDLFVERLVSARYPDDGNEATCNKFEPFAEGVVLVNPAIEANQVLQLKELSSGCDYPDEQRKLMHIISTDGDIATGLAFPIGQLLGTSLTWNQDDLQRFDKDRSEIITLKEETMDTITVGNLEQFRSGYLKYHQENWNYNKCPKVGSTEDCGISSNLISKPIPRADNEPLVFIKTDDEFMKNHNDVFNCNVRGYLASILQQSLYDKYKTDNTVNEEKTIPTACIDEKGFNFGACFLENRENFKSKRELNPEKFQKKGDPELNKSCMT